MVFSSADFQAWAQTDQFYFLNVLQVKVWLDNGLHGFYGLPVWRLASFYQLLKIEGKKKILSESKLLFIVVYELVIILFGLNIGILLF